MAQYFASTTLTAEGRRLDQLDLDRQDSRRVASVKQDVAGDILVAGSPRSFRACRGMPP